MTGRPTNNMVIDWDEHGDITVGYIDKTPEEYAALPIPPEPIPKGFDLGLSREEQEDPNSRTMASECAIYGLSRSTGHVWGE
jgi:hypothetical protein